MSITLAEAKKIKELALKDIDAKLVPTMLKKAYKHIEEAAKEGKYYAWVDYSSYLFNDTIALNQLAEALRNEGFDAKVNSGQRVFISGW